MGTTRKIVHFCSGSVTSEQVKEHIQQAEVKQFSVSGIKQRLREDKRGLRMKFRNLIKEYRQVFKTAKPEEVNQIKKLFNQDLVIMLSEAISKAEKGSTLNRELMMTNLVPSTRKISNKLNALVKRIGKFYNKNGYLNKQYQLQFNDLFKQLVRDISDAVYKNEINEDNLELPEESAKQVDLNPSQTQMKVAASASTSKGRTILFASEEVIDSVISEYDLDDEGLEEISNNSLTFYGNTVPKLSEMASKLGKCKIKHRVKAFSSEMVPISFVIAGESDSDLDKVLLDVINEMTVKGCLSVKDKSYNYDSELLDGNHIKFTIYVDKSKLACTQDASESNGIYINVTEVPEDYKTLFGPVNENPVLDRLVAIFSDPQGPDGKLSGNQELEVEDIMIGLDKVQSESIETAIKNQFSETLWNTIFS